MAPALHLDVTWKRTSFPPAEVEMISSRLTQVSHRYVDLCDFNGGVEVMRKLRSVLEEATAFENRSGELPDF